MPAIQQQEAEPSELSVLQRKEARQSPFNHAKALRLDTESAEKARMFLQEPAQTSGLKAKANETLNSFLGQPQVHFQAAQSPARVDERDSFPMDWDAPDS
jgi:hypothetical protein